MSVESGDFMERAELVCVGTRNSAIYEGRSKSFEPDYLPLDFWAKKCYWP